MIADKGIWHGVQRNIQSRQNSGRTGKTFLYRFAVDSPTHNHYRIARLGPEIRGVCHADEVSYLFKNIYTILPPQNSMEFTAIQRFVSAFMRINVLVITQISVRFHCSRHLPQPETQTIM